MKLKILLGMVFLTLQVSAVDDDGVRHYIKKYMEKKTNSIVNNIETISSYEIPDTNGWEVYFLSLDMQIKLDNKYVQRTMPKVVFTKGNKITLSLKDQNQQSYAKTLKPKVPSDAYDLKHLLVGNADAAHKILVFSDPFCPYCQKIVPKLIEAVEKNPKTFALYYYHLPLLKIHPASDITTKAMHLFQERGTIDKLKACYHLSVSEKERNPKVVLDAIKAQTGVKFTLQELNEPEVLDAFAFDKSIKKRLMVTGTPTIFLDGIWDPTRFKYKEYIK